MIANTKRRKARLRLASSRPIKIKLNRRTGQPNRRRIRAHVEFIDQAIRHTL